MKLNTIYNEDCITGMQRIPDKSIDVILSDPPYLYLKHKLDRPFDETAFFNEADRVLKKDGWIILFGRGTSFYRWNTMLAERGYTFKEEIIWDKRYNSAPLLALHRCHETVSIHCKGRNSIRKAFVPYLEVKALDLSSIVQDIKRLRTIFSGSKSHQAVLDYLETKTTNYTERREQFSRTSISSSILKQDRCAAVCQAMEKGYHERSIIPLRRDHYATLHPTQKPVRLLERLLNIVIPENEGVVLDPFLGSGSSAVACKNTGRSFIGFEIDEEYYQKAVQRIMPEIL